MGVWSKVAAWWRTEDDGAITVDWVVITAIVVLLGTVTLSIIRPGVETVASGIDRDIGISRNAVGN